MQRLIVVMVPTGLINGKKGFSSFMTFLEAQNNVHANWNLGKLRLKVCEADLATFRVFQLGART